MLGDWKSQTITYNAPALNDKPLDYQYIEANSTWYNYDISNLVRKWYGGENYGFALEANTSTYITLYTSDHAYYKPYVTINYVYLAGLEDYLVYEDQDVGRAGVGHSQYKILRRCLVLSQTAMHTLMQHSTPNY